MNDQERNTDRLEIMRLSADLRECQQELEIYRTWAPPGDVLSPIPSIAEVKAREAEIYAVPRTMPGLELNEESQLRLFEELRAFYPEQPFSAKQTPERRYWFENPAYSYADAILLYCMMRYARPRRIVEAGSGYSSAAMLDVDELFFDSSIQFTFIDPRANLLRELMKQTDKVHARILETEVQKVDLSVFTELEANDILFVDSSHVSKVGSDVNHIFFKVLPALPRGVLVHFHDIFYPFEYPRDWVYEGRAWNETYLLRAFLQYNDRFEIQLFNTFIDWFHKEKYFRDMPLVEKNTGGSIWLKKR